MTVTDCVGSLRIVTDGYMVTDSDCDSFMTDCTRALKNMNFGSICQREMSIYGTSVSDQLQNFFPRVARQQPKHGMYQTSSF